MFSYFAHSFPNAIALLRHPGLNDVPIHGCAICGGPCAKPLKACDGIARRYNLRRLDEFINALIAQRRSIAAACVWVQSYPARMNGLQGDLEAHCFHHGAHLAIRIWATRRVLDITLSRRSSMGFGL